MNKTIALVDDDRNILTSVSMALENEGFKVQTYLDGESAYIGMTRNPPDLAVIDLKMPKMNGEELLEKLRKKSSMPVILLTSKDDEVDELLGLKLGADDYVKKSGGFSIKVLIERIRVQFRKLEPKTASQPKNVLTVGRLTLDSEQLECEWGGKTLPDKLTTTEFKIIYELAKRPGVVKERAYLMNIAYKQDNDIEDRTIDSHVKRIRKKSSIPVILLTSKDDEVDELLGLKLGADDYVKKSGGFSIKVLIERIRVQFRKLEPKTSSQPKNILTVGRLTLDSEQLECEWGGKALPDKLTTTEFKIIYELAKRPGVVKERAYLMNIAYKQDNDIEDRTIDSHVKRIRKKFKKIDPKFSAIETRYGSGYRWNVS